MDELTRLLLLVGVAGAAVTVLAGIARWTGAESRRIRRGLKTVLKGDTHGFLPALGRGRGIGFNFTSNKVAVVWDTGAWGLVYDLDELVGAEAVVDGVVVGRVHRGEQRLALNAFDASERVTLRLVFDDLGHPDFLLDLWLPQDEGRRYELPPPEAIAEANRWLARIEALLRRPVTPRAVAARAPAQAVLPEPPVEEEAEDESPPPAADTPLTPLFARLAEEDLRHPRQRRAAALEPPPWEDAENDENDEEDGEEDEDEIRSLRL
ncbi:MAG: hypothetical protein JSS35_06805 [Proteobacteria bacterium]|nr:hypothetical protein [Pseudomonadota bacterium]